jgi:Dioxygenase
LSGRSKRNGESNTLKSLYKLAISILVLLVAASVVQAQQFEARYAGTTVQLQGQVTDTDGNPIAGAVVEIWQTDVNGNYNHPGDSDPSILIDEFQYFGVATTDENGHYAFLTVKTAPYESRPAHIHYKVKIDGQDVFTSQWYFDEDRVDVEADGVFGSGSDTLFLKTNPDVEADLADDEMRIASGNVVLDLNGSGTDNLTPTATQAEGPFYPVIDFSTYDNNLNSTAADDEIVLPVLETTDVAAVVCTRLNLNELTGEQLQATIPNFPNRMVREFLEYRPYVSIQQFRREIGKYVGDEQVAAWEPYVYVPIDSNNVDAETLMQLPGVDETIAASLIAGRPYASNEAFLSVLGQVVDAQQVAEAGCYLAAAA